MGMSPGWQFTNPSATSVKGSLAGTESVESRSAFLIPEAVTRLTALFKTTYKCRLVYSVGGSVIETWGERQGNLGNTRQSVCLQDIDCSSRDDSACVVCTVVRAFMFKQRWTLELYDVSSAVVCVSAGRLQSNLLLVVNERASRD